jgi:hypothetical protein
VPWRDFAGNRGGLACLRGEMEKLRPGSRRNWMSPQRWPPGREGELQYAMRFHLCAHG